MEIELNHLRCLMLDKFISLVTRSETTLGLTPSRLKEQSIHSFINHQSFDRSNSIFAEEPSRLESTIPNCRHQRIESKRKRTFRRATQPSPGRALPWWARTSQSQFNHLPPSLHKDFHPLGPCADKTGVTWGVQSPIHPGRRAPPTQSRLRPPQLSEPERLTKKEHSQEGPHAALPVLSQQIVCPCTTFTRAPAR